MNKYLKQNNVSFKYNDSNYEELESYIRSKAYLIIERKRATFYGIGCCLTNLLRAMIHDTKEIIVAGAYIEGQYGKNDVTFGTPCVMGANGIEKILELELNEKEKAKLDTSVQILKDTLKTLKL